MAAPLTLVLLGLAASPVASPAADRAAIMLASIERGPTAAEVAEALGSTAPAVLAELATDLRRPSFVRVRSLGVLGALDAPAAETAARVVLQRPQESPILRRAAIRAWVTAWPDQVHRWSGQLDHAEPLVREQVVDALARQLSKRPRLRAPLEARRAVERHERVRWALERALDGGVR